MSRKDDDFWEIDSLNDEYQWEVERNKREGKQSSFFVEDRPKKRDIRDRFLVKHTAIALCILGALFVLSLAVSPWFWIVFFVFVFLV